MFFVPLLQKLLQAQGCKVAVLDLNEGAAQKCADEINANGGEAIAVGCNVLELESMENARKTVNEKLGTCDILLNGAGGNNPKGTTTKDTLEKIDLVQKDENVKTFFDLDPNGISFVFNLNFLGTLIPTQVFAKDMAEKEKGTIIMVTSMNAFRPLTRIPAYSAAKAAVKNFTEWMAVHFAPLGIRVNAIAPGFFSTNRMLLFFGTRTALLPEERENSCRNTYGQIWRAGGAFRRTSFPLRRYLFRFHYRCKHSC